MEIRITHCDKDDINCIDLNNETNKEQFIQEYGAEIKIDLIYLNTQF